MSWPQPRWSSRVRGTHIARGEKSKFLILLVSGASCQVSKTRPREGTRCKSLPLGGGGQEVEWRAWCNLEICCRSTTPSLPFSFIPASPFLANKFFMDSTSSELIQVVLSVLLAYTSSDFFSQQRCDNMSPNEYRDCGLVWDPSLSGTHPSFHLVWPLLHHLGISKVLVSASTVPAMNLGGTLVLGWVSEAQTDLPNQTSVQPPRDPLSKACVVTRPPAQMGSNVGSCSSWGSSLKLGVTSLKTIKSKILHHLKRIFRLS